MKDLILIGGGGHCRSCIDIIELQGEFRIIGILDNLLKIGTSVLGYKVTGSSDDVESFAKKTNETYFLITIGLIEARVAKVRMDIFDQLENLGAKIATIISPLAHVSRHASVGKGTVVMHHSLINANAKVGKNCIINSKALIEHDSVVGDHCHISTAVAVNGKVEIEESLFYF